MSLRDLGVTIDQLLVLIEIADAGSFTAAARANRRTQGAVSYHMARLEEQLELQLFDRSGRRLILTDSGQAMVRHARRVLLELQYMSAAAEGLRSGVESSLSVFVDELFPPEGVAKMLAALESEFPQVHLTLTTGIWKEPVEALRQRTADIAVASPIAVQDMRMAPVTRVEFVPVVAPSHPLASASTPIPPVELHAHRRLVLRTDADLPEDTDEPTGVVWRLDNAATRRGLLLQGIGWARIVRWQVQEDLLAGRLVALHLDGWIGSTDVELAVMVDPSRGLGPVATWLYEFLAAGEL